MASISKENLAFLQLLGKNNNRDWFHAHKSEYVQHHENAIAFADSVLEKMNGHDNIETLSGKKSLFRIYRDVRFSKDKSPYKTHWGGGLNRATKQLRGGYYFHIQPGGQSFVGGGFWAPNKDDLFRIREEIASDAEELRSIINSKEIQTTFGALYGEQLKTAPKGFDKDHPDIDLLRFKQFVFIKKFSDEEVLEAQFDAVVNETFKKLRPFLDLMSDVLTTDSNGSPLF
jgi:uncharacterized protein (TIGR02453 family)